MPVNFPADRAGQLRLALLAVLSVNCAAEGRTRSECGADAACFTVATDADRARAQRQVDCTAKALVEAGFGEGLAWGVVPRRSGRVWSWSYYLLVPVAAL